MRWKVNKEGKNDRVLLLLLKGESPTETDIEWKGFKGRKVDLLSVNIQENPESTYKSED